MAGALEAFKTARGGFTQPAGEANQVRTLAALRQQVAELTARVEALENPE